MGLSFLPSRGGRSRVDSARESALAKRLHEQTDRSSLAGKPLAVRSSPFELDLAAYLRAAAGPPAWSVRLRRIQMLTEELHARLDAAWAEHESRLAGCAEVFADAWKHYVGQLDLSRLNELIDKHNAYYPIEAGLRMEWPSGSYIMPAGMVHPQRRVTPETLLELYPASLPLTSSSNEVSASEPR